MKQVPNLIMANGTYCSQQRKNAARFFKFKTINYERLFRGAKLDFVSKIAIG
jgi:hypothetical protein